MKLTDIIPRKAIIHELKARDKKAAITELCQAMKKAHPGERFSITGLVDAIMKREKLGTTGMGGGVAVPHAKLDGIKGISTTRFKPQDVVRHPLVQKIVEAYEAEVRSTEQSG